MLEWIDKAGYACAAGYSGSYCVTACVGNVHYTAPIRPGSLVEATAGITHTGRSSMHVFVTVEAADPRTGDFEVALDCLLVVVAVDEHGKAKAVPPWRPRTSDDQLLARGSEERIEARKRIHDLQRGIECSSEMTTPSETFRFLANPTDVNWGGNAHGGIVMRWIDEASTAVAARHSGGDPVAVYTGGIHFYRPIHIGHIVEIETRLLHTGPHSLHLRRHTAGGSEADIARFAADQLFDRATALAGLRTFSQDVRDLRNVKKSSIALRDRDVQRDLLEDPPGCLGHPLDGGAERIAVLQLDPGASASVSWCCWSLRAAAVFPAPWARAAGDRRCRRPSSRAPRASGRPRPSRTTRRCGPRARCPSPRSACAHPTPTPSPSRRRGLPPCRPQASCRRRRATPQRRGMRLTNEHDAELATR